MAVTPQGQTPSRASDAKHYVEYEEYVDYQLEKDPDDRQTHRYFDDVDDLWPWR